MPTHKPHEVKSILIFTWGNPSRGDDAIGPRIYDLLIKDDGTDADILTDFQLQIEHTVDLEKRERVLFIDASVSAKAPFEFYRLNVVQDDSYSTHAMSPESLLATYEKVNRVPPPPAYMLSVRGYDFDLGSPMSKQASSNLTDAVNFIRELLKNENTENWPDLEKT